MIDGINADSLRSFVGRLEELEAEKKRLSENLKEVYAESKGAGFDVKILKQLIKERRMDKDDLDEAATLLSLYRTALDGFENTPLGQYGFADVAEAAE